MPSNRIIVLLAAACILVELIVFVIKGIKNGFADKETLSKEFILRAVLVYVCAAALLAVAWFREFGLIGDLVVCFCSFFAVKIIDKQFLGLIDDEDDSNCNGQ